MDDDLDDLYDEDGNLRPWTNEEIVHAYGLDKPEKPMPSAQRAKEKPKVEPPVIRPEKSYTTLGDVESAIEKMDAALDRNIEADESSPEEFDRLLAERRGLYEVRQELEHDTRTEREKAQAALAKQRETEATLAGAWKDPNTPEEQRGTLLADLTIAELERRDLEAALPFAGVSDSRLSTAAEDARVAFEEAQEKAASLPAGSARRKRAEGEVSEAHHRALALEGELRRRKDHAALDAHAAKRVAQLTEKRIAANRQAKIRDAERTKEPEWFLEKLHEEA
jgi:hypothetical protein